MKWCAPISTVTTETLLYSRWVRATSHHPSVPRWFSYHHPFRPGTRPLACLAQGCMNQAHATRRCSGPTAPLNNGVVFTTATSAKQLQACQHLPSPSVGAQETKNRIALGGCSRTIAATIRPIVCNDCTTAYHRTCSGLRYEETDLPRRKAGGP